MINISFLVPCRNSENTIVGALDALLAISIEGDEIILIDSSRDSTPQIIRKYMAEKPELIKYIKCKNDEALMAKRLIGLKNASNQYVYFFDSDDLANQKQFLSIRETLSSNKPDILFFNAIEVSEHSSLRIILFEGKEDGWLAKETVLSYCFSNLKIGPLWLKIFKKDLYDINSCPADLLTFSCGEDYFLTLSILKKAKTFFYSKKSPYKYIHRKGSGFRKISVQRMLDCLWSVETSLAIAKELGRPDLANKYLDANGFCLMYGAILYCYSTSVSYRDFKKNRHIYLDSKAFAITKSKKLFKHSSAKIRLLALALKIGLYNLPHKFAKKAMESINSF